MKIARLNLTLNVEFNISEYEEDIIEDTELVTI